MKIASHCDPYHEGVEEGQVNQLSSKVHLGPLVGFLWLNYKIMKGLLSLMNFLIGFIGNDHIKLGVLLI